MPWDRTRKDCTVCPAAKKRLWGCLQPGTHGVRSLLEPDREPRRRCPKALLNPDTDEYDHAIATVLSLYQDAESFGVLPETGGLSHQRADVLDAFRVIRGVWAQCERLDMDYRMEKAKNDAKNKGPR